MNYTGYTISAENQKQQHPAGVRSETWKGLTAVFADMNAAAPLSADCAAEILIEDLPQADAITAVYRHTEFWCRPHFTESYADVPAETQLLICRKADGDFLLFLPLCGDTFKCTLAGTAAGLALRFYSGCSTRNACKMPALVIGAGNDPHALIKACTEYAVSLAGDFIRTRENRVYPELFDHLGWCSWDAMEVRVSEEGLMEKCTEFREKDIPVRWAIIDDMWADVPDLYDPHYNNRPEMFAIMHTSPLNSFKADAKRFPDGLAHCIARMHEAGFKVGMWHPITGYWRGLIPDGPAAKALEGHLVTAPDGMLIHGWTYEDAAAFYEAFHTELQNCGADFLKIDNQSEMRINYAGMAPIGTVARNIHSAMEDSLFRRFDGRLINCMGMANENVFSRPATAVSRCSDDFLPEDSAWFIKHILQCSFNSFYQGDILWCDWDMWWTDDAQGVKNSLLRAVSGGPIYVSDPIGRSRKALLEPLCFADGRILRCDRPAAPTADCLTGDPLHSGRAFKLRNRCGESGVLAVFNLSEDNTPVSLHLSAADCGLPDGSCAVWEYFSRTLRILSPGEAIHDALKDKEDFRLYILAPVIGGFAAIGDPEKMIAPKAVLSGDPADIRLYEDAPFLFYSEQPVESICVNGKSRSVRKLGCGYIAE